jgi:LysR family glycine cleavage system transcriptional activator
MIVQSCIAGRGVMIGRSVLIEDELKSGILVAPFGMPGQSTMRYRLLMRKGALADPKIATFRMWLYEELGRTPPGD